MFENLNFYVIWSDDDGEFIGRVREFGSLCHLASTEREALSGIQALVENELRGVWEEVREKRISCCICGEANAVVVNVAGYDEVYDVTTQIGSEWAHAICVAGL